METQDAKNEKKSGLSLGSVTGIGKKIGGDLKEVFTNKDNLDEAKELAGKGLKMAGALVDRFKKKGETPTEGTPADETKGGETPGAEAPAASSEPTPPPKKSFFSGLSLKKRSGGWILWEILAGLGILGYMGYQVMGTSSSTAALNNAATAAQEAEALQAEVHSMYPTGFYAGSGDISSNIVTQKSTPANMLTGGCSTGLCGPFSGSYFTVVPAGTTFTITLQPTTIEQCSQIIEQQAGSGIWQSINGLSVSTTLAPATVQSACGGGSVSWISQ